MRARTRGGAALLMASLAMLVVCWAVANPIGAAPDEPAHYIKALGAGGGDFLGMPATRQELIAVAGPQVLPALNVEPLAGQLTRRLHIPPRLQPGAAGCTAFSPAPATCLDHQGPSWGSGDVAYSYVGTYQPFVYVPVGLAMFLASDGTQGFIIGRLTFGLISLLLIAAGLWMLSRLGHRGMILVGALTAITPMVVFTIATISASSVEIAAGFATASALLHLAYAGDRPRTAWILLAVAGTALALSRTLGPLWLALAASTGILLMPGRAAWQAVRQRPLLASSVLGLLGMASVTCIAWQLAIQPRPHVSPGIVFRGLLHGVESISASLQMEIGIFGWLDTDQLGLAYLAWGALVSGLVVLAWRCGNRRERRVLAGLIVLNLILVPLVNGAIAAPSGGGVQGRWFLPFAVMVPLFCGVLLARGPTPGRSARRWVIGVSAAIAAVQFLAWYQNSRRYAVGPSGRLLFFLHSSWAPPWGWTPWLGLAVLASAGLVASAALLVTARPGDAADQGVKEAALSMTAA